MKQLSAAALVTVAGILVATACSRSSAPAAEVPPAAPAGAPAGGASGDLAWMTDYQAAQQEAEREGKRLFLDFSGSDWCGWCKRLDREIFSTPEFKAYAERNLVPVLLDFPRRGSQNAELKAQNQRLAQQFAVRGYPTIIVLDSSGKKLGQLGYMRGGPEPFLKALDGLK